LTRVERQRNPGRPGFRCAQSRVFIGQTKYHTGWQMAEKTITLNEIRELQL
jgi:hypothetical protein